MHCKPVFLLLVALLPLLALSAPTEDQQWEAFKAKHKKNYKDKAEEEKRRNIFKERARKVAQHNDEHAKGKHSHSVEINRFADKTDEELEEFLGAKISAEDLRTSLQVQAADTLDTSVDRQTQPSVDLRNDPCMPPIKDQGRCATCWAFAAANMMEFLYCKKNNLQSPVLLSEQNLADCTYDQNGCKGGFYTTAWYKPRNIVRSEIYPYVSGSGNQTWTNETCAFDSTQQVTHVKSYKKLANESMIEQAVSNFTPVAVTIRVAGSFFRYKSGVYSDLVACPPNDTSINHSITLVGYNNTNDPPYWILRNSWGDDWGMGGYFYLRKGINLCNVAKQAFGDLVLI